MWGVFLAMQGDLTNPAYFDFISFAQLGTISAALDKPRNVFQARLALHNLLLSDHDAAMQHQA